MSVGARSSVFVRALSGPVTIRELEHARAAHHLERVGEALRAAGLGALGERADRLAANIERVEAAAVRRLHRLLRRSRTLAWATSGVGRLEPDRVAGRGLGLVARACGLPEDLRTQDGAYNELGFSPLVEGGGDACARWRLRLAEVAQSLLLASAAGTRTTGGTGSVESPWGSISSDHAPVGSLLELLPGMLEGSDWGDVITTIVSLDLDLEEAART